MKTNNVLSGLLNSLHLSPIKETMVDKKDHGSHIRLQVGNRLTIALESHPGSGFQWIPTENSLKHFDDIVVDYKPRYHPFDTENSEITRISFLSTKKGSGQIILNYVKSWQPNNIERVFCLSYEIME